MALISLTIAAGVALAGTPVEGAPMQPSTGWNIDYAETSCTLSRSYGTGDDTVSLGLIPQTGGGGLKIVVMSKDTKRFAAGRGSAQLTLDGAGPPATADYFALLDQQSGRIALIRGARAKLPGLGQAKTLQIVLGGKTLDFAIPQMNGALKALDACEADLVKGWGFDLSLIAVRPIPIDPGNWPNNADYPDAAMRANARGETGLRVTVGLDGKPTACAVTQSSNAADLDAAACGVVMKRGKFEPAVGTDGKPVVGLWVTSFMWELGTNEPMRY